MQHAASAGGKTTARTSFRAGEKEDQVALQVIAFKAEVTNSMKGDEEACNDPDPQHRVV